MGIATEFVESGIRDEEWRVEMGRVLTGDVGFGSGGDLGIGRMRWIGPEAGVGGFDNGGFCFMV